MLQELMIVKDFLVALVITLFVKFPMVQLTMTISIFLLSSFFSIKLNPFESKILAITKIMNELTYLAVCLIFLLYHFLQDPKTDSRKNQFFGYGLISVIGLGVALNILLGLLGFVMLIVEKCRKSKRVSQAKLQPESGPESKVES